MSLTLTSRAFEDGERIPERYCSDGDDISPPLEWHNAPPGTKTLALVMDDPDAPKGHFVHWIAYNIPASERGLMEDFPHRGVKSEGTAQGRNDFDRVGYDGPAPPPGDMAHRYVFRLYALDDSLEVEPGAALQQVEDAMRGHVIGQTELIGTFRR